MAISRFLADRWPDVRWFPFWFNGVPFENTYSPLLQAIDAVVSKAAHCSTALAFHAVIAFFYCLGPVFLFLFAWKASKFLHAAFLSALLYSLYSPSLLLPAVRDDIGSWHNARRLQTLVHYGEGGHNVVLSLLPLALLCAWLAVTRRNFVWCVTTGVLLGALVLTNAFAAVDLAVGIVLIACLQAPRPPPAQYRAAGGHRRRRLSLDLADSHARPGSHHTHGLAPVGRLPVHAAGDPYRDPGAGGRCRPLVSHPPLGQLVRPLCSSLRIRLRGGARVGPLRQNRDPAAAGTVSPGNGNGALPGRRSSASAACWHGRDPVCVPPP